MKDSFLCPKCLGYLNVGDGIVFSTRNHEGKSGLIQLNPQLGNYKVENHPSYDFTEGDYVDFFCPLCHVKLTSEKNDNLAKVIMIGEDLVESEILFSKIFGEKSTYKITKGEVEVFGDDADNYGEYLK